MSRHRQQAALRQTDLFNQLTISDYLFDKDKIYEAPISTWTITSCSFIYQPVWRHGSPMTCLRRLAGQGDG